VTALAFSRPFWPLFLHVLGAMTLFGAVLTALITALAGRARSTFTALLVGIPAWVVMRVDAQWIYSREDKWPGSPSWIAIGQGVADAGLIILLLSLAAAYWWQRSDRRVAGRIVVGLSVVYLVLLGVAWLAMSGKWS
jgi:hypothetical protein